MYLGAVTAMMVWQLDLQLPMQSVPITTTIASSNIICVIQDVLYSVLLS